VQYVFSDKTGTLTQNVMEFKTFMAGSVAYSVDMFYKQNESDQLLRDSLLPSYMAPHEYGTPGNLDPPADNLLRRNSMRSRQSPPESFATLLNIVKDPRCE